MAGLKIIFIASLLFGPLLDLAALRRTHSRDHRTSLTHVADARSSTRLPKLRTPSHNTRDPPRDPNQNAPSHSHARKPALRRPSNRINRLLTLRVASDCRQVLRRDPHEHPRSPTESKTIEKTFKNAQTSSPLFGTSRAPLLTTRFLRAVLCVCGTWQMAFMLSSDEAVLAAEPQTSAVMELTHVPANVDLYSDNVLSTVYANTINVLAPYFTTEPSGALFAEGGEWHVTLAIRMRRWA